MYSTQDVNRRSHYGDPQSVFNLDISLQTVVKCDNTHGPDLRRMVRWDLWSKTEKIKSRLTSIKELKRVCYNLNLPKHVGELAATLLKKAYNFKLSRGRSIEAFVCACLYLSCRDYELPVTLNDLLNESDAKIKRVKNSYRYLLRTLNLKVKPLTPQHFVSRYVNELGLELSIEREIEKALTQLPYGFINGQNPKRILAGTIYLICKKHKLKTYQWKIAKVCDISEASVRYIWKEIAKLVKI
jgi:transcription initiation factor TFIIB